MRPLENRIALLEYLGELFREISGIKPLKYRRQRKQLDDKISIIRNSNPWFTEESIFRAISIWGESLEPGKIHQWLSPYNLGSQMAESKNAMVIMAGNIPLVGFHDFICTIISGNRFIGKLSSRDNILFPLVQKWIINYDPEWGKYIFLTSDFKSEADCVIATGSNNTSRLISQTFSSLPMIIRHNRNSIALISGDENDSDLEELAKDILSYYGLGCRNVSLLFIPENYKLDHLAELINRIVIAPSSSYENNLVYQRALFSMHNERVIDAGKLLFTNRLELNSPLGLINYAYYNDSMEIEKFIKENSDQIQCVVGNPVNWINVIPFGQSQKPGLYDYADGVDTLKFLISLK